jgi:hypothetical protein
MNQCKDCGSQLIKYTEEKGYNLYYCPTCEILAMQCNRCGKYTMCKRRHCPSCANERKKGLLNFVILKKSVAHANNNT